MIVLERIARARPGAIVLMLLGCASPPPPERPVTAPIPDCRPELPAGIVDDVRPTPPPTRATTAPASPPPSKQDKEPLTYSFPGDVELEVSFQSKAGPSSISTVGEIRLGERVIYPPACGDKASGLCSRAHRTLRGDRGGDERDATFGMGRDLLVARFGGEDGIVRALFAATVIGSPLCGTSAFWLMRADANGIRVTEPVRGCFLGGAGTSDDSMAFEVVDTEPPTYIFRSPLYLGQEALEVYTLDERAMAFTRRYVGKTAKPKPPR